MNERLVILSGPSGVGKDTVIDAWKVVNPLVERVVAATTRKPREGEHDGDHYHFVTEEEFSQMVERNEFLEHEHVHGNWYGTPRRSVEHISNQGKIAVLKIDVQGALRVMHSHPVLTSVFLMPPSWEVLEERIRQRGTESEEAIEVRLRNAREEIELSKSYSHHVVNDDLTTTIETLESIINARAGAI